jgi:serine protease Do
MDPRIRGLLSKVRSNRFASMLLVLATLTIGILIGSVVSKTSKANSDNFGDATPIQMPAPQQLSNAFASVAKQIEPTVVNINTESTIKAPTRRRRGMPQNPDDEGSMQDFFDRFFGGVDPRENAGPEGARERSLGSGVIVDAKGYIVTNQHVVDKADRIRVQLLDDATQYDAKVVGTDRETDLAVIKIEPKKSLPAAKFGNSDSLQVGDWVLAVGSPFGLEESVTAGIISSKSRTSDRIGAAGQFQSFLQTDAAINPGNSGGPLVNMSGEVVGINTAILTQTMGYQGVGFALPSKIVASIYNQLIGPEHKVVRGSIGVTFNAKPDPALARVYGLSNGGVVLSSVYPNSPAEAAGLKVGDAITAIDGKPIKNGDDLVTEISSRKPGSKTKLSYVRGGKQDTATVTVQDRTKLFPSQNGEEEGGADNNQPSDSKFGASVRAITPDLGQRLGVPAGKGVIVQDVKPQSFAEDIGLERGSVILEINRQPVNSEEDFRRIQSQLKSGQDVAILVRQGRGPNAGTIFLSGTLP